jgi:hypothetical protein
MGERDDEGEFPQGTINGLVEERLAAFARSWRAFAHEEEMSGVKSADGKAR